MMAKNHFKECFLPLVKRIFLWDVSDATKTKNKVIALAAWTAHPPQEQQTRVRIPPGHKVLR
jgi:hypothetical protein